MNIYDKNGYVDIRAILKLGMPFNVIIGGRGTGKTYTSLKVARDDNIQTMIMRRTQAQIDIVSRKAMSPYKRLALDDGFDFDCQPVAKGIYEITEVVKNENETIGSLAYMTALSTISNLRGFDGSDIELVIFDEFIPELHERPIKHEADAFFNAYETINRNRELEGFKPLQVLLLSNSNRLDSEILAKMNLIPKIEKMLKRSQMVSVMPEKGVSIILLSDSLISKKKAQTALYRLTEGTDYMAMAIDNDFSYSDMSNIISRPLSEYQPRVSIGNIYIYQHKSTSKYYVTDHMSGSVKHYEDTEHGVSRFRRDCHYLKTAYMQNNVEFESYAIKADFTKFIK